MINNIANDCEVRWKYVDDLTLGEICKANGRSKAQILIDNVKTKTSVSNMTVNDNCKYSIVTFSFLNSSEPNLLPTISDSLKVSKIKLFGVIITSDLKWEANTTSLVKRGNAGLQMLKLMSKHSAPPDHLFLIFTYFVRPILEYAAPVWRFGLTADQSARLERVQKRALMIVSKQAEMLYEELLTKFKIQTREKRREKLCMDFGRKSLIRPIHKPPPPLNPQPNDPSAGLQSLLTNFSRYAVPTSG